jgi:hypothetical protein
MFLVIENDQILGQFDNQKQAEEEAAWIAHLSGLNAVVVPEWQLNSGRIICHNTFFAAK